MQTGLTQLFGVRCPKAIANPTATKVHHTFEGGIPGGLGGTRVGDKEAFCGKYSVKNPWFLFRDEETGLILGQSVRMVKTYMYFMAIFTSVKSFLLSKKILLFLLGIRF